jgi:predicted GTPase
MGLESCTNEVQTSQSFRLDDKDVVLVDTPGFDDTTKSDTDVLKMIAAYLQTMFVPDISSG